MFLGAKTTGEWPLEPQSRLGDKPVKIQVVCPQNGTAALKGLSRYIPPLRVGSSVRQLVSVLAEYVLVPGTWYGFSVE